MNRLGPKLIDAYRIVTAPYRQAMLIRWSKQGKVPVFVVYYHRVANDHPNPWTISCEEFERQVTWYQENFDIVDLQECQRRISSGSNSRPTLAITFDDGYAENCEFGLPLLIERRIPVTYFVTTYHPTKQKPFQHDVELGRPLPVNTIESLRSLDLAGVEIGAHTRTHPDLGKIDCDERLVDEVITSTLEMEQLIGRKIRYFAFPFGQVENLNRKVFAILREAGFLGVCSAYGGWNAIGDDAFHIQRVHGDPQFSRMLNWLTFDPRIGKTRRYDYSGGEFDGELLRTALSRPSTFPSLSVDSSLLLNTFTNHGQTQ